MLKVMNHVSLWLFTVIMIPIMSVSLLLLIVSFSVNLRHSNSPSWFFQLGDVATSKLLMNLCVFSHTWWHWISAIVQYWGSSPATLAKMKAWSSVSPSTNDSPEVQWTRLWWRPSAQEQTPEQKHSSDIQLVLSALQQHKIFTSTPLFQFQY